MSQKVGDRPHSPLQVEMTIKDIRSRGRTDGNSRRHSSSGQLLISSSGTALAGTARSWDMLSSSTKASKHSRQSQDRKLSTSRQTLRTKTIERKGAAFLGEPGPHTTGKKAGLVWPAEDSIHWCTFPVWRIWPEFARWIESPPGDEHLHVWIAVNVALRRCGEGEGRESPDLQPSIPWGFLVAHLGLGLTWARGQEWLQVPRWSGIETDAFLPT